MKIEANNLRVGVSDLAAILEGSGEYTLDEGFMAQAGILARHAVKRHLEHLRQRIEESDNRFPLAQGLLDKLDILDEASIPDLSRMLHVLTPGNIAPEDMLGEAGFTPDHAPALMEYVYEKLGLLEQAIRLARQDVRTYSQGSIQYSNAYMNFHSLQDEEAAYGLCLKRLTEIIEDAHVPARE